MKISPHAWFAVELYFFYVSRTSLLQSLWLDEPHLVRGAKKTQKLAGKVRKISPVFCDWKSKRKKMLFNQKNLLSWSGPHWLLLVYRLEKKYFRKKVLAQMKKSSLYKKNVEECLLTNKGKFFLEVVVLLVGRGTY